MGSSGNEVLTCVKGINHFCQLGHLYLILTFWIQKGPLIDSFTDGHTLNILFKLKKFTRASYISRDLDAFDSEWMI